MAITSSRSLKVNIADRGLDLPEKAKPAPIGQDFDGKLADAQRQLEFLQSKRQELENQKVVLEELNQRKQDFLHGQLDVSEKLSATVTAIEREVFEMRQEIQDLEQTKDSFASHLKRIEALNPESWPQAKLADKLESALTIVDRAEDEFEQASEYFAGNGRSGVFGNNRNHRGLRSSSSQEFSNQLRSGLAFNLPVIILGTAALLAFLIKY